MGKEFKEIHVVFNTHWDREFRFPFQKTRMLLVKMMDYMLDLLEREPDYESYTLDAHCIMVEDYLEARPEHRGRIEKLVKEKRLFMGPWYTLPDIPNIGQEAVVRNLLYGHKISSEFGHTMKVGYTPCSWGQTGQLPQIYSGFDIDAILFYRGISPHESTSEFIWEGADGTRALAHRFALFARYNYYYLVFRKVTYGLDINDRIWKWGEEGETPFKSANVEDFYSVVDLLEPNMSYHSDRMKSAIREMLEMEGSQYFGPYFLAMHGHDISWPHPKEPEMVKDADEQIPEIRIVQSNLEKYMETLKSNLDLDKLRVLKGERRTNLKEGYWTYLLPGTISARTRLKQQNFRTESLLVDQAEPAHGLNVMLGSKPEKRFLDLAWRHLMCTHTHDANAGCAPDDITEDVRYNLRQSSEISNVLVQESLKNFVKKVDTSGASDDDQFLMLFNPLPFERSEVVEALIDLPSESNAESVKIADPEGKEADYQVVTNEPYGLFVDNPWNVPQAFVTKRFRMKINAGNIPSLGWKVYRIESREKPQRSMKSLFKSGSIMANDFIEVKVNDNATVSLTDKRTGSVYNDLLLLEDSGEVGNAWRRIPPQNDRMIYSNGVRANIQKIEDGPLNASVRVDFILSVPKECPDEYRRSEEMVEIPMTYILSLQRDARRLDIKVRFDNRAFDHRLRMLFPTDMKDADTSFADSHFDVVERDIELPERGDWKEPLAGTYPYRSFVDMYDGNRGLAVLSEGLQEFEITRDERKAIAVTILRAVRIKLEVAEGKKQELPDRGPQSPGMHEFRLALYPHEGNWSEANCPAEARKISVPVRAVQFGKNKSGEMPLNFSFLKISNPGIQISAIKLSESGNDLIIRCYNPSEEEHNAEISMNKPLKKVTEVNLNEGEIRQVEEITGNGFGFHLSPKKIKSFRIKT